MSRYLIIITIVLFVASLTAAGVFAFQSQKFSFGNAHDTTDEKPVIQETTARFLAVGDIMLSRGVAAASLKVNNPELPFSSMSAFLQDHDFNFGNLESPLNGNDRFSNAETLVFNAPKAMIPGLAKYKFSVVNLANNHALDQGTTGVDFTRQFLDAQDLLHMGTGNTLDEAWRPAIVTANGIRIAFIGASYSSINDGGKTTNDFVARMEDTARFNAAIQAAKAVADFVVVTMHAGTEYTTKPNELQQSFAHAAIDGGADMVIGAHPHWVQTIEQYKGAYIFYSLGNFIFDQDWSQKTKEGLTLDITLKKTDAVTRLSRLELVPVIIEQKAVPRMASEEEGQEILESIGVTERVLVDQP